MILFYEIVEIVMTLVNDIIPKRFADGTRIGTMPIGCDLLWCMTHNLNGLLEKSLRCLHISLRT